MDYLYYLFAVFVFLGVVIFIEGAYLLWNSYKGPESKHIEMRLKAINAGALHKEASIVKQRLLSELPSVERFLLSIPRIQLLDRLLLQAGVNISVAEYLSITLISAVCGVLFALTFSLPVLITIAIIFLAGLAPYLYMLRAKQKRMLVIEEQLPEALDLMARAMKSGHAFPSALQMVGTEMKEPIAFEFKIVFDEINYGVSTQSALMNLTARVPSTDLSYFVTAVLVQRETGGNLSELLGNISELIRARLKLLGTVRVLSAEGRISAWILVCLPFVLGLVLKIVNPTFLDVLITDPLGVQMVTSAMILMVVGIFVMQRIIKIRV